MATLQNVVGHDGVFIDGDWILSENMDANGKYGVIQLKHVGIGEFYKKKGFNFINEETFKTLNCTEVLPGDILISRMADPIGRACIVPPLPFPTVTAVDVTIVRVDRKIADTTYIMHLCNSHLMRQKIDRAVRGTTRARITRTELGQIDIPLPALPEQKRIASLLRRADRLRQVRRTAHDLGDELLQSVFLEMFGDFNQYERIPFEELAIKSKNSFTNGPFGSNLLTTELVSEGVPVIYIRDITTGYYQRVSKSFVTTQKAKELDSCRADGGDVLVAKVGDPPGTAAVYPLHEPAGVISQDVIRIKPNREKVHPEFLVKLLNSEIGYNILKPILVEGTRERFGLTPMKQLEVPLPPLDVQEEFGGMVRRVESLRARMSEAERQVEGLFQSLLQECFGG
jgi:type I restriction enzyme, S subunit